MEAYAWRVVRELLSGIGWGLLGFFLVPLTIFTPFVDWLRASALGEVSPAHDLLTGELRAYWGVVLIYGVGAALQVRMLVRTVLRFFRNRPEEKRLTDRLEDEFISLTYLSGPGPDQRRAELKKQLDQFNAAASGRLIELLLLVALAVMVLVLYGMLFFTGGPSAAQVHIPELQAELEQLEHGQLETGEFWVHPRVDDGGLPGMWGSGYRRLTVCCHIIGADVEWVDVLVPVALEFTPSMERPFRESQSILWNLENAQRYEIAYTPGLHLVDRITPVP